MQLIIQINVHLITQINDDFSNFDKHFDVLVVIAIIVLV
jgi:hypothetical protein